MTADPRAGDTPSTGNGQVGPAGVDGQDMSRAATVDLRPDGIRAALERFEDRFDYEAESALAEVRQLQAAATAVGDPALVMRARLVQATIRRRGGDLAASMRTCWEVNGWATEHGDRTLLSRSYVQLSAGYQSLGDAAAVLEYAVCAADLLDDSTPTRAHAAGLMRLGDALVMNGSFDAARTRYRQAERTAAAGADVDLRIVILNNLAVADQAAGDVHRSWAAIELLREVAADAGQPLEPDMLDTIAWTEIALGRYADAELTARLSIERHRPTSALQDAASPAEYRLTLAVAQRHRGALTEAQVSLDACIALCDARDLAAVRVRALQEQAEVYAAGGDPGRAFHTHKEFHAAYEHLQSTQREAQARTRQVMFEVAEARQEAERFREQARRDPLTGLRNRRYVDEHLPALLTSMRRTGPPVTVAILDLDHFKRVNDTCSHEVGDQVLVAVAGLLAAAAGEATGPGSGFAARLGGEEFLLVITDVAASEAVRRLETLRRTVAEHPWGPVTGTLAVTVSVGVAVAGAGSTRNALLERADACLYVAKRRGRNQVMLDPA
jgi:diguanylate cyclase (GGDEF)-like protein